MTLFVFRVIFRTVIVAVDHGSDHDDDDVVTTSGDEQQRFRMGPVSRVSAASTGVPVQPMYTSLCFSCVCCLLHQCLDSVGCAIDTKL